MVAKKYFSGKTTIVLRYVDSKNTNWVCNTFPYKNDKSINSIYLWMAKNVQIHVACHIQDIQDVCNMCNTLKTAHKNWIVEWLILTAAVICNNSGFTIQNLLKTLLINA